MSDRVKELFEEAKRLTIDERIELADLLSMSKVIPDAEWQSVWAAEAAHRIAAYERGEIEAEDFDAVMERLRKEFLT